MRFKAAAFLAALALPLSIYADDKKHFLSDGHIVEVRSVSAETLPIEGNVLAFAENEYGLFYVKSAVPKSDNRYVGFFPAHYKVPLELLLPAEASAEILDFFVHGEAVFILLPSGRASKRLMRISLNTGSIKVADDILAACMSGDSLVVLKRSGQSLLIVCGNGDVPCGLSGFDLTLRNIENRLVLAGDGRSWELFDIKAFRSIGSFPVNGTAALPEDCNLIFTACDELPLGKSKNQNNDSLIFYKIFINNAEEGRTQTGSNILPKTFEAWLTPGEYHLIYAERWELDRKKSEYVRANNVYQPGSVKLYMPENRILKLRALFNGKEYYITSDTVRE